MAANLVSYLFPPQGATTQRERWVSGVGGFLAVFVTTWMTHIFVGPVALPYMIASMGASTVLLLGAPHSPLSQPWAFAGGHLVSATVGVTVAMMVPNVYLAAGLAVGGAIFAMYQLRCLHPPGGATALLTVIGDQRIHALGYHFILVPVMANVAVLLLAALVVNTLIPGRRYPHGAHSHAKEVAPKNEQPAVKLGFGEDDLLAALKEMDGYVDIAEEDLERIYSLAVLHAHRRRTENIHLADIMTREVVSVSPDTSLEQVWNLLRERHIRGVPVVDGERRIVGMLTIADFLRTEDWRLCGSLARRVKGLFSRRCGQEARRIMTVPVALGQEGMHMTEAFWIFAEKGINHLPVVDDQERLVGMVTRLDLLGALYGDIGALSPVQAD